MTVYIMKENIKGHNGDTSKQVFVVNAFSSQRADELFFERICEQGELIFDRIGNNYYSDLRNYINMHKLILNPQLEYLLVF